MSGIELAGLILGAIPLIISALENYKKVYRGTNSWIHFRREFLQYQEEVTIQTTFFSENIEELLASITCSDSELRSLLKDPAGSSWSEPRIEEKIRERLPSSFKSYMVLVEGINGIIEEIMHDLDIVNGDVDWRERPLDAVKSKMMRHFFRNLPNSKRMERLKELGKKNKLLRKLLHSSNRLSKSRRKRSAQSTTRLLKTVRESAATVHRLFVQCWECKAQDHQHSASLYLENYNNCAGSESSGSDGLSTPLVLSVYVTEKNGTFGLTVKVSELSTDISKIPDFSHQSKVALAPVRAQFSSPISLPIRLRCNSITSIKPGTSKRVRFSPEPLLEKRRKLEVQSKLIRELCGAIKSGSVTVDCCGYLVHSKLGFALLSALDEKEAFQTSIIKQETLGSILTKKSTATNSGSVLTRKQRLKLAVRIAAAFMYFYGTPWIDGALTKEEIGFPTCDDKGSSVLFDRPFISYAFSSSVVNSASQITEAQIRRSLLSLAFILLELCFGRVIPTNGPFKDQTTGTQMDLVEKWQEDVGEEFGERYADAIKKCIYPDFLASSSKTSVTANDETFQEGVYSGIFKPLEETLKFFTMG